VIRIKDTIAGDRIWFHCAQSLEDIREVKDFVSDHDMLGIDTESTGINSYRPTWRLRTVQVGDAVDSYVIPAKFRNSIAWLMRQPLYLLGFNGPHDIRSIDCFLGYRTGVVCEGEGYIPGHYADARNQAEGGCGHGLKEQAMTIVDSSAGKWEKALKAAFKEIKVPVPGQVYKSGPLKGTQKMRKILMAEGWEQIDIYHPAYVAYAAADPLLTWRVWHARRRVVEQYQELYGFDFEVQQACDELQRRAMRLDVEYTRRLSRAYRRTAEARMQDAAAYGCNNIQSSDQVAETLIRLGAKLTQKTDTGKWSTKAEILRKLVKDPYTNAKIKDFVNSVLVAKQLQKRREAYTDGMLREMDVAGRIHPSINPLAARTTRMSVSGPPLQQLPTMDKEDELVWMSEEEVTDGDDIYE
jgi:DNA polymerase I